MAPRYVAIADPDTSEFFEQCAARHRVEICCGLVHDKDLGTGSKGKENRGPATLAS